jgi:hypothetical protein
MIKEYKNLVEERMSAFAITAEVCVHFLHSLPKQCKIADELDPQTFQTKYTMPAIWGEHIVPQPTLAKPLMWLRARAANEADPYFADFVLAFQHAFTEEIGIVDHGTAKK